MILASKTLPVIMVKNYRHRKSQLLVVKAFRFHLKETKNAKRMPGSPFAKRWVGKWNSKGVRKSSWKWKWFGVDHDRNVQWRVTTATGGCNFLWGKTNREAKSFAILVNCGLHQSGGLKCRWWTHLNFRSTSIKSKAQSSNNKRARLSDSTAPHWPVKK